MSKRLNLKDKLDLLKDVAEEITTEEELKNLLKSNEDIIAYDGFEPSGKIHIAQGLLRAININKVTKAGIKFKVLVADWHGWANHKMGGDIEKIRNVGKYFIEVWKASGMDLKNIEFVWASDLVKKEGYWETVMKIAIKKNLARILRTVEIMGRKETDALSSSQILYPLMQCADIFMLNAKITQLGMDQRKVNMLAREVGEDLGFYKPIIISHHMLLGLLPPTNKIKGESSIDKAIRMKMSKSKPDSAIFMTDTREDIKRKINKAWCPEGVTKENPILEYCKYIVFAKEDNMIIDRPQKYGGTITYSSYKTLENDYKNRNLFPLDLKISLVEYLDKYIVPVRKHLSSDIQAKKLKKTVDSYNVTR